MATVRRGPGGAGGGGAGGGDVRAENRRRLEELLKRPDNAVCADCPERGASIWGKWEGFVSCGVDAVDREGGVTGESRLIHPPYPLFLFRPALGVGDVGHLHLHQVLRHPPQPRYVGTCMPICQNS